ncbi:hypothetical protein LZ554_009073 [Drepanopeziza brunnea f. sp. 'monogermtubi']|nr:hypothetical protein LZ554_009073 [Drepanopeziza brunnea f. sp. 'monogermtubi']
MLRSKSILAILLALGFLFDGAHGVFGISQRTKKTIGYATVSKEDAERINDDNKLHKVPSENPQLGPGLYLVNHFTRLPQIEENWYCAIKADTEKIKSINKVYVPKSYKVYPEETQQTLWYAGEEVIEEYLKTVELMNAREPSEALRFSWVPGIAQMQMLIPERVIEKDEALELWAACFKSEEELKEFSEDEDFINWENMDQWRIVGVRGLPEL